jgi:glycosyltransferase involved in cell wall biosynthesis
LFEAQIGEPLSRASIVRCPYNVRYDFVPPWPKPDPELRLASVARLDPGQKGQDLIVKVLAQEKWKSRNVKVRLYGAGPAEGTVSRLAARHAGGIVEFMGVAPSVEQIWGDNHGLIMPSRYENMPAALVEAMLCSRMSIVTDVGGVTELFSDGEHGFLVPAPTAAQLDRALELAWQQREHWQAIGVKARQRALALVPRDPAKLFGDALLAIAADRRTEDRVSMGAAVV